MCSLKIIDFKPRHTPYIGELIDIATVKRLAKGGPCFTIMLGKKTLAGVGLYRIHPKMAEAWMLVSPRYRYTHAKTILKAARYLLDREQISGGFTRVQIIVKSKHPGFVRWSQLLGFEIEGLARAAAEDGDDVFLMSRIR